MGRQSGWRGALHRVTSNRMMGTLLFYAVVAVLLTMMAIHMVWNKHRFFAMPDSASNYEEKIHRGIVTSNHSSEEQPIVNLNSMKLIRRESSTTEKAEQTAAGLIQLENTTKPTLVVLVSSSPRSGSSFLGELLSSPRQALYLFEPFWYYSYNSRHILKHIIDTKADKLVKHDLRKLLECRISEMPEMFDSRLPMNVWRKPLIVVPLNVKQRTTMCHDLKLRVIKVVRPKLSSVLPLLENENLNVHIIQLVRDPRAIVNSVGGVEGWSKHLTPSKACIMLRNDIESSLEFTDHPRLIRVRYEDMVARPEEESRRMFNRMGLEMPQEVLQFLDLHTRQTTAAPATNVTETANSNGTASSTDTANSTSSGSSSSVQVTSETTTIANATADVTLEASTDRPSSNSSTSPNVTSSEEPRATEPAISPQEFKNFYGTIRDAKFDGLHWLKDMDPKLRKETEQICKDVLDYLEYPLVYPQERLIKTGEKTRGAVTRKV